MGSGKRHFLRHLHPDQVTRKTLHPLTTLGLGIACLTCLGVLFVTGLTLFLYYVPDQEQAYERILHITTTLHYGKTIRNLHYLAANSLFVLSLLHLARVFLTGSYKGHLLCWMYGLAMMGLVLLGNFTGYLLSWDQISYWAIKIGGNMAGYFPLLGREIKRFLLAGEDIGGDTLPRAFAIHAGLVPVLFLIMTGLHLWRLRKDGGLSLPPEAAKDRLPARPWLYRAEGAVALLVVGGLFCLSLFVDAPISERADPQHPPNPAKAPWYFVGFQEMVSYSAFWGGVVVPCGILLFLILIPLLDRSRSPGGTWFARDRWPLNLLFLLVLLAQLGLIAVGQWFRGENWGFKIPF